MNNYTITSPISGTIIEKAAKVGDALSTVSYTHLRNWSSALLLPPF